MNLTTFGMPRFAVAAVALLGLAILPACESTPSAGPMVEFSITPSRSTAVVGETVTITSYSANVVGTDSRIQWHTTGGDLETRQSGRVAQVTFDEPGTYNISANLMSDGVQMMSDATTIVVRPLQQSPTIRNTDQGEMN